MYKKIVRCLLAFAITIAVIGVGMPKISAASNVYYVATNGSDSNPGTLSQPFLSLSKAFSVLQAGDTLYVRGGTYYKQRVNVTASGTSSAYINVKNYPGETVVFDGENTTDSSINGCSLKFDTVSYWSISGITMQNWICCGVYVHNSNHINISNMTIHDINNPYEVSANPYGSEGIEGEGSSYITVSNSKVYNIGVTSPQSRKNSQLDHGAYVGYNSNHWTFNNDSIHDSIGCGIQFYAGESHTMDGGSYSYIYNNLFYNCALSGVLFSDNTQSYIYNNTFYGNGIDDIDFYSHATDISVYNNIFGSNFNSNGCHVWWRDETSYGNVMNYNSYRLASQAAYRTGYWYSFSEWQSYFGLDQSSVSGNPYFLDESNYDLRVHGYSNTLGMASVYYAPTYDYASHLRQTSGEDMGAYDYNDAYDNFEGNSPSTYNNLSGSWSATTDGSKVYSETQGNSGYSFKTLTGSTSWTNYNVTANVKVLGSGTSSDLNAGVMGRVNSSGSSYYLALIRPTEVDLYKNVNGSWTTLGYYSGSFPTNSWNTLTLGMNGSTITVSVNSSQLISTSDSSITSGQAGFYSESAANFDEYYVASRR